MKRKAKKNVVYKKIQDIERQFNIHNWEDVQRMAKNVIPQLEELATPIGQSEISNVDVGELLEKVP